MVTAVLRRPPPKLTKCGSEAATRNDGSFFVNDICKRSKEKCEMQAIRKNEFECEKEYEKGERQQDDADACIWQGVKLSTEAAVGVQLKPDTTNVHI